MLVPCSSKGPQACGKTRTAREHSASEIGFDVAEPIRDLVSSAPELVLAGNKPRLIDEWQIYPSIWNHVRRAVDDAQRPGQFILAGSSMPSDDPTRHSGA